MSKISEALTYGLTIRESADDGSDFTNPAADYRRLFLGEDGQLHVKDSAGTVTAIGSGSGNVATDAIWDAAGDLALGTGANTAAKLAIGATGTRLGSNGTTASWSYPPGYQLDYAEVTSSTNLTATTEGTANTIITGNAVAYDGSTVVVIEAYLPYVTVTTASTSVLITLHEDGTSLGTIAQFTSPTATSWSGNLRFSGLSLRRRLTPSNASHTYTIRGYVTTGTQVAGAGAGGAGTLLPGFIRITKA